MNEVKLAGFRVINFGSLIFFRRSLVFGVKMGQSKRRWRGHFHWFKVKALYGEEEEFGVLYLVVCR